MTNLSTKNQIINDPTIKNQANVDVEGGLFTSDFQAQINLDFSNGYSQWDLIKVSGTDPVVTNSVLVVGNNTVVRSQRKCTNKNGEAVFDFVVQFSLALIGGALQRSGALDSSNGFYFMLQGTNPFVGYRNQGIAAGTVARNLWLDPLDGTGPSKQTVNFVNTLIKLRIRITTFGEAFMQVYVPNYGFVTVYIFTAIGTSSLNFVLPSALPISFETDDNGTGSAGNFRIIRAQATSGAQDFVSYNFAISSTVATAVGGVPVIPVSLRFADTYQATIPNNRKGYIRYIQYNNLNVPSQDGEPVLFSTYKFSYPNNSGIYDNVGGGSFMLKNLDNGGFPPLTPDKVLVNSLLLPPGQQAPMQYFERGQFPVFQNEVLSFSGTKFGTTNANILICVGWEEIL